MKRHFVSNILWFTGHNMSIGICNALLQLQSINAAWTYPATYSNNSPIRQPSEFLSLSVTRIVVYSLVHFIVNLFKSLIHFRIHRLKIESEYKIHHPFNRELKCNLHTTNLWSYLPCKGNKKSYLLAYHSAYLFQGTGTLSHKTKMLFGSRLIFTKFYFP